MSFQLRLLVKKGDYRKREATVYIGNLSVSVSVYVYIFLKMFHIIIISDLKKKYVNISAVANALDRMMRK